MARRTKNGNGRKELGPGSRVAIYCRDSGGASQERSVGDQRKELDALATARQWHVTAYYVDEARSGASADNRPAFQQLVADCHHKPPPVDGVLVWSLSRLGRNELEGQFYVADLRLHGVEIVSATENIPAELSAVYEALIRWKDARYLDDLAVNVRRGHESLLAAGLVPGGRAPIGYTVEHLTIGTHRNGKPRTVPRWVIDDATAPLVRRCFELRADGQPIQAIWEQTRLTPTRAGFCWVLHNPAYKGTMRWGGREYTGVVPAIVSPTLWEAAQRRERVHPRRVGSSYLLSGLLRCAVCGRAMTGRSHRKQDGDRTYAYRYYECGGVRRILDNRCAPMARAEALELDVLERVLSYLTPDVWAPLLAAIRARLTTQDTAAELQRNERDAAEVRQAISNLYRLAERAGSSEELEQRLIALRAQLAAVDARRLELSTRPAILDATPDELALFLSDLRTRLEVGDIHSKRELLRRLIERLEFGPDGLFIKWRAPTNL